MSTNAFLWSFLSTAGGRFTVLSATPSKLGPSPTPRTRPGHAGHSHSASGCAGDNGEFGESKNPRCMELTRAEIGVFDTVTIPKFSGCTCAGAGTGRCSSTAATTLLSVSSIGVNATWASCAEIGDAGRGTSAGLTSGLGGSGVAIAAAGISTFLEVVFGGTALIFGRIIRGFVDPLATAW